MQLDRQTVPGEVAISSSRRVEWPEASRKTREESDADLQKAVLRAVAEITAALAFFGATPVHSAWAADIPAALSAIADTADRLCGIVATQGEANSTNISGDVHGELVGLARRLASVGISGSGDIASSKYQNVLQKDLPATLKDVRECKLQIFNALVEKILPGATVPPGGTGAPSSELLQSAQSAPLIDFTKDYDGPNEVGLYSCANASSQTGTSGTSPKSGILCYGTLTRSSGHNSTDFHIEWLFPKNTRLVDNFHVEHGLRRESFLNGLGEKKKCRISPPARAFGGP